MGDDGNDYDLNDIINGTNYNDDYELMQLRSYIDDRYGGENTENESLFELIYILFENINKNFNWNLAMEFLEKFNTTSDDEIMKIFNLVAERINFMKTVLQRKYVPSAMSKEDFIKYYDPMFFIIRLHDHFGISDKPNTFNGNTLMIMLTELEPEQIRYDYLDEWFDPEINEHRREQTKFAPERSSASKDRREASKDTAPPYTAEPYYNINYINPKTGLNALHSAIIHNHPRLVKLFLENGADPFIVNNEGFTTCDLVPQICAEVAAEARSPRPDWLNEYYHNFYNPDTGEGFKELAEKYKPIMRKFGKRSKRKSKKKRNKY